MCVCVYVCGFGGFTSSYMGDPPPILLLALVPLSLSESNQICHIYILLHRVALSALGAAAPFGSVNNRTSVRGENKQAERK